MPNEKEFVNVNIYWDEWAKQHPEVVNRKRKVILINGQSPGDLVVWTGAIRDLALSYPNYQIDVRSPCSEVFQNNPRLTPLKDDDLEVEKFNISYDLINESGWRGIHFADAWRHDMEKKLGVPIKMTSLKPELWISDEEKSWYHAPHCEFGWDGPYWVINAGRKQDNELKQYHRWQEFVDLFNEKFKGRVKLVQMGHSTHIHPKLNGVLDLVGMVDNPRQLIRLCYWADGTVGPISFQFTLSQAFEQPAVVVAGGKEGPRWQRNNTIRFITNVGALPCAKFDGCWKGGQMGDCKNIIKTDVGDVPKCFEMIKPYQIVDAIYSYYEGGIKKLPTDEENQKFQANFENFQKSKKTE